MTLVTWPMRHPASWMTCEQARAPGPSVLFARETDRELDINALPERTAISVITIAELQTGVLVASDTQTRARRLATLGAVSAVQPLAVTGEVAHVWARLRVSLAERDRRAKINNLWIAAIALANSMDVVTQDDDFDPIEAVGGPLVIRV